MQRHHESHPMTPGNSQYIYIYIILILKIQGFSTHVLNFVDFIGVMLVITTFLGSIHQIQWKKTFPVCQSFSCYYFQYFAMQYPNIVHPFSSAQSPCCLYARFLNGFVPRSSIGIRGWRLGHFACHSNILGTVKMGIRFLIDYENSLCHFSWWSKPKSLMNLFVELSMFKLDFGCVLGVWTRFRLVLDPFLVIDKPSN